MTLAMETLLETNAPIPTWFGVGGRADALARPGTLEELLELRRRHDIVRTLGDGANLLVDDDGVDGLVVSLERMNEFQELARSGDEARIRVQAGANLPKLILEMVRRGLGGLETLGGIPATLGGALVMNAGGSFGQICDCVGRVFGVDENGREVVLERSEAGFGYRASGLGGLIITAAEINLKIGDPARLRTVLKDVMAYKAESQPMAERSAGCVFKNPTVDGKRLSAGRLIDEAGCKGWTVRGARVSEVHANFITAGEDATASDILRLINQVRDRVLADSGVRLETEVVVWRREGKGKTK